jgi:hypothetical protein
MDSNSGGGEPDADGIDDQDAVKVLEDDGTAAPGDADGFHELLKIVAIKTTSALSRATSVPLSDGRIHESGSVVDLIADHGHDSPETEFGKELPSIPRGYGPSYRRRVMHLAQEISRRKVMPWLKPEQEEGGRQYYAVALRFVEMGNNFLKNWRVRASTN